jgi:hypothetical protein
MTWTRFHPLTRIAVVAGTVVAGASFTGWERVGNALAHVSPGGSFESRCERLPASSVEVVLQPLAVTENRTEPFASLARLTVDASPDHRTIGVTQARFGHRSTVEVSGLEDRRGARACARPRVTVELFVQPITVYIASEYAHDPCRVQAIREHEQRHVDVFEAFARDAAKRLPRELSAAIGDRPSYQMSLGEAQRHLDRRIGDALSVFMRDAERTLAQRQADVDTPQEYQRVNAACKAPG